MFGRYNNYKSNKAKDFLQTSGTNDIIVSKNDDASITIMNKKPTRQTRYNYDNMLYGLVNWWKLNEGIGTNCNDSSPNTNNGTMTNMEAGDWVDGPNGENTLDFDGANEFISISKSISYNEYITDAISISFWTKFDNAASTYMYLQDFSNVTNDQLYRGLYLQYTSNYIVFATGASGATTDTRSNSSTMSADVWYNVVVTAELGSGAGGAKIYINGSDDTHTSSNHTNFTKSLVDYMYMCGYFHTNGTGFSQFLNGKLSDFRVYNRVLTATEVSNIYNITYDDYSSNFNLIEKTVNYKITDSIVAWLKLNEGGGTTNYDYSENNTTGTMGNMGAINWVEGPIAGYSLDFDGVNEYILTSKSISYNDYITDAISISFWTKFDNAAGTYMYLQDFSNVTNDQLYRGLYLQYTSNYIVFATGASGAITSSRSNSSTMSAGVWYNVVVTAELGSGAGGAKIYINGSDDTHTSSNHTNFTKSLVDYMYMCGFFAASGFTFSQFLNGKLSDFRVYNRVLTATEVSELYNINPNNNISNNINYIPAESKLFTSDKGFTDHKGKLITKPHTIRQDALVGWWIFDEGYGDKAFDKSGNGNITTNNGSPVWTNDSEIGLCLELDGTDDSIDSGSKSGFEFQNDSKYSVTLWYKGSSNTNCLISCMDTNASYAGWDIYVNSNVVICHFIKTWSSEAYQVLGETIINDNQWHHIAMSYDGSVSINGFKIYIDGSLESLTVAYNNSWSGNITYGSNHTLVIGARRNSTGYTEFVTGKMSDIRIYDIVLEHDEIIQIYNERKPQISRDISKSLAGWWKLNEGAETLALDSSGIGNNGTLTNGPTYTTGKFNENCIDFDGSNDYVDIDDFIDLGDASNFFGKSAWTVSLWVNGDTNPSSASNERVILMGNTTCNFDWKHTNSNFVQSWSVYKDGGPWYIAKYSTNLVADTWYHITGTFDGTNLKAYLNGSLETITNVGGTLSDPNTELHIGSKTSDGYFNGQISDVRIYNVALNATEIKNIYESSSVNYEYSTSKSIINDYNEALTTDFLRNNDLMLQLTAQDSATTTYVTDYSGNRHHSNVVGNVTYSTSQYIVSNKSLSFDGTGYLVCDGDINYSAAPFKGIGGATPRTLTTWFYLNNLTNKQPIISYGGTSNKEFYDVFVSNTTVGSRVSISLDNTDVNYGIVFNDVISSGSWYFLGLVLDTENKFNTPEDSLKCYVGTTTITPAENKFYQLDDVLEGDNLVGWWKLDEGDGTLAVDSSGSGNNGTLTNGPTYATGKFNETCIDFDGGNDYIDLGTITTNFSGGFTLTGWVKWDNASGGARIIDWSESGSSNDNIIIRTGSSSAILFEVYIGSTQNYLEASSYITTDTWTFVTFTIDSSGNAKIYKNVILQASGALAVPASVNRATSYIGKSNWPDVYFNGKMSDIRVYNVALTANQISQLYNKNANKINTDSTQINLQIGKGVSSSNVATNYFNGYMDDIRLYSKALNIDEITKIWGDGSGSYTNLSGSERTIAKFDLMPDLTSNLSVNSTIYNKSGTQKNMSYFGVGENNINLNSGLIGWWKLDEGSGTHAMDSSSSNNGILTNGPTYTTGKFNDTCIDFDGSNDYVDGGRISVLEFQRNSTYTVSFWANGVVGDDGNGTYVSYKRTVGASTYEGWSVLTNGSYVYISMNETTWDPALSIRSTNLFEDGLWHHFVFSYDGTNDVSGFKVYLDGIDDTSSYSTHINNPLSSDTAILYTSEHRLLIGAFEKTDLMWYFDGKISDVRIYDRVLSAFEVKKLYEWTTGWHTNTKTGTYALDLYGIPSSSPGNTSRRAEFTPAQNEKELSTTCWFNLDNVGNHTLISSKASSLHTDGDFQIRIEPIRAESLIGWWKLNEGYDTTNYDYSGSGNNGTMSSGGGSGWTEGNNGWSTGPFSGISLEFDGTDDYVEIVGSNLSGNTLFDFSARSHTISCWIYVDSLTSTRGIVSKAYNSGYKDILLSVDTNGALSFGTENSENNDAYTSGNSEISTGTWYHICYTAHYGYDSSNPLRGHIKFYKNGSEISGSYADNDYVSTHNNSTYHNITLKLGILKSIHEPYDQWHFNGKISDFRIYNTLLTADEIQQIYVNHHQPNVSVQIGGENSNTSIVAYNSNITTNQWHHIGVNYSDLGLMEMYLDGSLKGTAGLTGGTSINLTSNVVVGATNVNGVIEHYLDGKICDIRMYNKMLTASQMKQIYLGNYECVSKIVPYIPDSKETYIAGGLLDIPTKYVSNIATGSSSYDSSNASTQLITSYGEMVIPSAANYGNGYVLTFDGSDDYLDIGNGVLKSSLHRIFTITGWINADSSGSGTDSNIISKWETTNCYKINYDYTNNELDFSIVVNGSTVSLSVDMSEDTYHHIACVCGGNNSFIAIYIDGERKGIKFFNGIINVASDISVNIGRNSAGGSTYFKGKMTDIRFYETTLTEEAIYNIMNEYKYKLDTIQTKEDTSTSTKLVTLTRGLVFHLNAKDVDFVRKKGHDKSKYKNICFLRGGTSKVDGQIGKAFDLDGTDDFIEMTNSISYNDYVTTAVTISFWINFNDIEINFIFQDFPKTSTGHVDRGISIQYGGPSYPYMRFWTGASGSTIETNSNNNNISINTWYHVVITAELGSGASGGKIYINGVDDTKTSSNHTNFVKNNTNYMHISSIYRTSAAQFMNGKISDFRIYNRVLSQDEISMIYLSGYKTSINTVAKKYTTNESNIYISNYSIDNQNNPSVPLPIIGRDSLRVHYNFSRTDGDGKIVDENWKVKPVENYRNNKYLDNNATIFNHSGVLGNSASIVEKGYINTKCVSLSNLSQDYLDITDGANMSMGDSKDFTVACWINSSNIALDQTIWMKNDGASWTTNGKRLYIDQSDNNIIKFEAQGGSPSLSSNYSIYANEWKHVAVTKGIYGLNDNILSIYVDGKLSARSQASMTSLFEKKEFRFGSNGTDYFDGLIDDIRVYNIRLNDYEIEKIYNNELNTGPLLHYTFEENTLTTKAYDMGTAGDNLTITGATYKTVNDDLRTDVAVGTSSLYFDGTDDYCQSSSSGVLKDHPRTVSMWIKRGNLSALGSDAHIFSCGTSGGVVRKTFDVILDDVNNAIVVKLDNQNSIRSDATINDTLWHHVAAITLPNTHVSSGGTGVDKNVRIFVDGINRTQNTYNNVTLDTNISASTDMIFLGKLNSASSNYFNGYIDDFRVYNMALTPSEVKGLYYNSSNYAKVNIE